ncbi:MAG: hypothetical protein CVV32_01485 [Methanomicrobiales archaeon HGW-Methanomicrobiales-3]|jgi:hypothetical protein|nr:MAG: hypothetical protein CVV32_01485 [Methanomicrobiales archaeon HGW-Methanomicrobiales-3]
MVGQIAYTLIFGKPVIVYLGLLTLALLLLTAAIPLLNRNGIRTIPLAWHPRCAMATICLAIIHGMLGILAYR